MNKITLYTSDTCHRCKIVKELFAIHTVAYNEITDRELMLNMELEGVPAIEVDGQIIDNWVSVLGWLKDKGYYSFEVSEDEGN